MDAVFGDQEADDIMIDGVNLGFDSGYAGQDFRALHGLIVREARQKVKRSALTLILLTVGFRHLGAQAFDLLGQAAVDLFLAGEQLAQTVVQLQIETLPNCLDGTTQEGVFLRRHNTQFRRFYGDAQRRGNGQGAG